MIYKYLLQYKLFLTSFHEVECLRKIENVTKSDFAMNYWFIESKLPVFLLA